MRLLKTDFKLQLNEHGEIIVYRNGSPLKYSYNNNMVKHIRLYYAGNRVYYTYAELEKIFNNEDVIDVKCSNKRNRVPFRQCKKCGYEYPYNEMRGDICYMCVKGDY
jgi:hypothetical protein